MSKIVEILESMEYGLAPEGAQQAHEWLEAHQRCLGFYIDGKWVAADKHFATINPATGEQLARIGEASVADVDTAVAAAKAALPEWKAIGPDARSRYLYAIARQVQKHSRLFAVLETLDNGKPIRETRDLDIPLVARHFYYHAGWARLLEDEFPNYEPVGVCAQIIPWNFPLLMLSWKIAPALAAGNTVVLKPAEFTSLTALLFAEICHQVGVPKGVVNIVTGAQETGQALVGHPDVNKVAFTGSTEVGKIIRKQIASTDKKLSLELGGKSPFVVFEDADMDSVVEGIVDAIWFNQGQVCCAGSRLIVQEGIAERLFAKIRARMDTLRVADPMDKATDIGAIIDISQLKRISELVAIGVSKGATLYQPSSKLPAKGWFYPPTLLCNVQPASTVAQVEIFGPVLVAMTFRTPSEAVEIANNTVFGLASSVWTQNLDIAHDIASRIHAGTVWVNCSNQLDASTGFGGVRESGYGREGGIEGMYEYLKPKLAYATSALLPDVASSKDGSSPAHGLDRTHKLYIGGKQSRPDGGYALALPVASGGLIEVARGNRKDVRNAVEAADAARKTWGSTTAFNRSQVLYYFAENLEAAGPQMELALRERGHTDSGAAVEFTASIERILFYAAWADRFDGTVHQPPARMHVYTRNEPLGVVGVVAPDEAPLLGLVSLVLPLIAMGNSVVVLPSAHNPLPAVELYRVLDASDLPAGAINIVTGTEEEVAPTLGSHAGVSAIWHFRSADGGSLANAESAGNLKQTWCMRGQPLDWSARPSLEFLRRAVQVKNIWIPYGS